MLDNFQLAAIRKQGAQVRLLQIPIHQVLQNTLAKAWHAQLDSFINESEEIPFNAGYQPEEHELFCLNEFTPPEWLAEESSISIGHLDSIGHDEAVIASTKGITGFARERERELVLFQNFNRSHVVRPGSFLLLRNDTYESTEHPAITLDNKLAAVYLPTEQKLLFRCFRTVNTFLPLGDFYREASEQQIRDILTHPNLFATNPESFASRPSQWFRKRFAMLRDSGVLDNYTVGQIQARSRGYDVAIHIQDGKMVFPEDHISAKKILQFLNEELFKGAITDTLYETNSKREAG